MRLAEQDQVQTNRTENTDRSKKPKQATGFPREEKSVIEVIASQLPRIRKLWGDFRTTVAAAATIPAIPLWEQAHSMNNRVQNNYEVQGTKLHSEGMT